jgi:hypothetical protein
VEVRQVKDVGRKKELVVGWLKMLVMYKGATQQELNPVSIAGYQKIFTTAGISIADVWLMENNVSICPLCGRELAEPANKHHLIPVSKGGKNTPTIVLHKICHDKIHAVFTENELKRQYNSISQLQQQEEIAIFIKWVRKKEPAFYDKSVKTRSRRLK